jgi:hypothetical protein
MSVDRGFNYALIILQALMMPSEWSHDLVNLRSENP